MTEYFLRKRDGFDVHVLRSRSVEVGIIPDLGAKIVTLRCLSSDREWMWSPPAARLFANQTGDPFPDSTIVGADECFPTIAGCAWAGRELPDHGEVWSEPWAAEGSADGVVTTLSCPISPFDLQRTVRLHDTELFLSYELTNRGKNEESFLWALHPLLAIRAGDQIELPTRRIMVESAIACPLGERGDRWDWPEPSPGIRLDRLDFGPHSAPATKVFSEGLTEGRAAIVNADTGEALEFSFDLDKLDTVGVWINLGGWADHRHVAIEPTNGAPDSLNDATRENRCGRLAAGASTQWSLILKVTPPNP